jgi:hypothetical protein
MRTIILTAAAAAAALLAAGCASSASQPAQQPGQVAAAPARPANPVPILKLTGAKPEHGASHGSYDMLGDLQAAGSFGRWEQIEVTTAPGPAALRALLKLPAYRADDYNSVIVLPGRSAVVVVTAWEDNGPHWAPGGEPEQIAQRVGGHLAT